MCAYKHCNYAKVDDIIDGRLGMLVGDTLGPQLFNVHTIY